MFRTLGLGLLAGCAPTDPGPLDAFETSAVTRVRPDWTATGDAESRGFGERVVAADVNGDGFDDLLVLGAGRDDSEPLPPQVYAFHGSAAGLSKEPDWADPVETGSHGSHMRIVAGDVNGDGFDDLVLGDPAWPVPGGVFSGGLFQILGSPTGLETKVTLLLSGEDVFFLFGPALAIADVNGDGMDDLLAGFPEAQGLGRALLLTGSAKGLARSPQWNLWNRDNSAFGLQVDDLGDVNGDGFDDVDVQMDGINLLFHGSAGGLPRKPSAVRTSYQFTLYSYSGLSGLGDLDGDGYGDAWGWSAVDDVPILQFYKGSESGLGKEPFATHQGAPLWDRDTLNAPGFAGAAGDANGDGHADLFFADPHTNTGGLGTVALVFGPLLDRSVPPTGGEVLVAPDDFALFGHSVTPLDANGDGVTEIAVGAPNLIVDVDGIPSLDVGAVFVYDIDP